jgi:hypothetical protein
VKFHPLPAPAVIARMRKLPGLPDGETVSDSSNVILAVLFIVVDNISLLSRAMFPKVIHRVV